MSCPLVSGGALLTSPDSGAAIAASVSLLDCTEDMPNAIRGRQRKIEYRRGSQHI
jgi:hypothetical protein